MELVSNKMPLDQAFQQGKGAVPKLSFCTGPFGLAAGSRFAPAKFAEKCAVLSKKC